MESRMNLNEIAKLSYMGLSKTGAMKNPRIREVTITITG